MISEQALTSLMEWSTYITGTLLITLFIWAIYSVRKGANFEFLSLMIGSLLVSNFCFLMYIILWNKRSDVLHA